MSGTRQRAALLLLITFLAGGAAGVALDRLALAPAAAGEERPARQTEARDSQEAGRDRGRRQTTIERFADDLGLTASQRESIEGILDRYRSTLREMREEVRPRFHALIDSVRAEIEAVLTQEQVEQYRNLLERRREDEREEESERASGTDGEEEKER